jgi:hypothetical protein
MATKKETVINIRPVEMRAAKIHITGITPLITHRWSEKAKKEMRDKQTKATKTKARDAKNIWGELASALYWVDGMPDVKYEDWDEETYVKYATGARFGFPVTAIKQGAASSVYRIGAVPDKMGMRASFLIDGVGDEQLGIIESDEIPAMREDMVKVGMGTADLRYRPMFRNWGMTISIRYNANGLFTLEQIVNAINLCGQTNGIGEWRNERDGQFGMFVVDNVEA